MIIRLLHRQGWLDTESYVTVVLSFHDVPIGEMIEGQNRLSALIQYRIFLSDVDEYDKIVLRIFYYAHDRSLLLLNKGSQESHTLRRTFVE